MRLCILGEVFHIEAVAGIAGGRWTDVRGARAVLIVRAFLEQLVAQPLDDTEPLQPVGGVRRGHGRLGAQRPRYQRCQLRNYLNH